MNNFIFSDIAIENFISDNNTKNITRKETNEEITIIGGCIKTKTIEKKYAKPVGEYISIYTKRPLDEEYNCQTLGMTVAKEIKRFIEKNINKKIDSNTSLLVIGAGNKSIASDSLGPLTVETIHVNRHIKMLDEKMFLCLNSCVLSAIEPGVYGNTGINTVDIILGVIKETSPDCLIVVDSLFSRSIKFLGSMLQISDGGICLGSGVDIPKKELSIRSVGIPVISLGVPFVTDSFSVISNFFSSGNNSKKLFEKLRQTDKTLISLNNCEISVKKWASLLAESIEEICVL